MRMLLNIIAIICIAGLVLSLVLLAPIIGFMRLCIWALLIYLIYRVSLLIIDSISSHIRKPDSNQFDSNQKITYGNFAQGYDGYIDV